MKAVIEAEKNWRQKPEKFEAVCHLVTTHFWRVTSVFTGGHHLWYVYAQGVENPKAYKRYERGKTNAKFREQNKIWLAVNDTKNTNSKSRIK